MRRPSRVYRERTTGIARFAQHGSGRRAQDGSEPLKAGAGATERPAGAARYCTVSVRLVELVCMSYDAEADTLYVNYKKPSRATDSELTDDDVIVRYEGEEVAGFTILHAGQVGHFALAQISPPAVHPAGHKEKSVR